MYKAISDSMKDRKIMNCIALSIILNYNDKVFKNDVVDDKLNSQLYNDTESLDILDQYINVTEGRNAIVDLKRGNRGGYDKVFQMNLIISLV